jgi:alpha-glucosidase
MQKPYGKKYWKDMGPRIRFVFTVSFLLYSCLLRAADTLLLESPAKVLHATLFLQNGQLQYQLQAGKQPIIEPSPLGIQLNERTYGKRVTKIRLVKQQVIREETISRLHTGKTIHHCVVYTIAVQENDAAYTIECRLFNNGYAFRYVFPQSRTWQVQQELTSFTFPATSRVWYFERNSDWKLKSYAGLWQQTTIEKLPKVSSQGPIQGKPLVIELPSKQYALLTEAALYHYSGMRLEATGNRSVQVNFTEGKQGFIINGTCITPWRVLLYAHELNALVNNHVIEHLNPLPDKTLFATTDYIKPGKSVWSWITRQDDYMQPSAEMKFIDAAAALHVEYTLLDEGWETTWNDKWAQLKTICDYAARKKVRVWVWKHSRDIRDSLACAGFLDSVAMAGAVGIKTDFMNSEAKPLIDFEEGLLKAAAQRKLMVNFHGCQAPTGESKTYPNEMTREGIRGLELNIMKEPIPAWHNAALPFTRFICGHGDYTPGFFSNKGHTTYTHQLALLYLFNSPFQCIAENPVTLLQDTKYAPILPLLKTLPVIWDETIVLPGSAIGTLAAFARRRGSDWYVAVINGTDSAAAFRLLPSFLQHGKYKATVVADDAQQAGFTTNDIFIQRSSKPSFSIPATGGLVIVIKRV